MEKDDWQVTQILREVLCRGCEVSLSEWKGDTYYVKCPLCGSTDLTRSEWED